MYYQDIFRGFQRARVDYLVVGGLAVVLHGIPRMTQDLDIVINLAPDNVARTVRALRKLGYRGRPPVSPLGLADPILRRQWEREKNMKVFSFYHTRIPVQEVDILFAQPIPYARLRAGRVIKQTGKLSIPLIAIDDLIRLKKKAARAQDLDDIRMLKAVRKQNDAKK